jgi:hypothetical protein
VSSIREIWKPIPGWSSYEVSTLGRVRRVTRGQGARVGHILRPGGKIYPSVVLNQDGKQRQYKTAVLVLMAFVGPRPKGLECCHEDDNPKNSELENLRWDTHKENAKDALKNGRMRIGQDNPRAILTEELVKKIREEHIPGRRGPGIKEGSMAFLAIRYNLPRTLISQALRKTAWRHVPRQMKNSN